MAGIPLIDRQYYVVREKSASEHEYLAQYRSDLYDDPSEPEEAWAYFRFMASEHYGHPDAYDVLTAVALVPIVQPSGDLQ